MSKMDSTMSLFGTEYSLFGEDLLFSPTVPTDEGEVTAPQDGLKVTTLSDALSLWQISEPSQGQDILSIKKESGDPLEDWLDTRIDLFDLIGEQNAEPSSESFMDLGFDIPMEDQTGLLALRIEAEKTSLELCTNALQQPKVVQGLPSQGGDNVYDQGLGLLELLTSNVSQKQAIVVNESVGLDFGPSVDTSGCILSPMSPEDVETILSSGPASPESLVAEESFESLMSSVLCSDSSFAGNSIMEEVSMIEEDTKPSVDVAFLSEMFTSGNTSEVCLSDSDMENYPTKSSQRGSRTKVKKETSHDAMHKIKDRKLRKKQQNKDAATRYRQKKKQEQDIINRDVAVLEGRNTELKDKVDQMTREIRYLKSLLSDVYKARANTKSE